MEEVITDTLSRKLDDLKANLIDLEVNISQHERSLKRMLKEKSHVVADIKIIDSTLNKK